MNIEQKIIIKFLKPSTWKFRRILKYGEKFSQRLQLNCTKSVTYPILKALYIICNYAILLNILYICI
jgi:hypothetical protein